MPYLVLARKYRPKNFEAVIGQEHITDILKSAIESQKITQAYLFCGPRGIGKTSCARILAKCLNCQKGMSTEPDDTCIACQEIAKGTSMDVLEIDGASNRGIDEIRALRENVKFAPSYGRYKIYIVDEVHMLTTEAFNALLKTLEEPPEHVKFILATTAPQKIPSTIISRCQRFDFKRIPLDVMAKSLAQICESENLAFEEDALYAIAKASDGGLRDALSILDQLSVLGEKGIKTQDVYTMLGLVEQQLLFKLADAVVKKDCKEAFQVLDDIVNRGKDIKQLLKDFIEHFRHLMVMKVGGKSLGKLVDYPVSIKEMYLTQSALFELTDILKAIENLIQAQEESRSIESVRLPFEVCLAKLTYGYNQMSAQPQIQKQAPIPAPIQSTISRPTAGVSSFAEKKAPEKTTAPTGNILKNNKGELDISSSAQGPVTVSTIKMAGGAVTLEAIQKNWDALTFALSREKMSLATFLQDARPMKFQAPQLLLGFPNRCTFQKESAEEKENVKMVEKVFTEQLKSDIVVKYTFMEEEAAPKEEEPHIKSALDTFGGKVVSRWHNE